MAVDLWWGAVPALAGWSVWRAHNDQPTLPGYQRVSRWPIEPALWVTAAVATLLAVWDGFHPSFLGDALTIGVWWIALLAVALIIWRRRPPGWRLWLAAATVAGIGAWVALGGRV